MDNLNIIDFGSSQLSIEVAAGGYHTCVVRQAQELSQSVSCFGSGIFGQLGDGSFSDLGDSPDEKLAFQICDFHKFPDVFFVNDWKCRVFCQLSQLCRCCF